MSHSSDESTAAEIAARRNFIAKVATAVVGAVLGLVPLVAGLAVFLDPLRRKKSGLGFLRVASLDSLPRDIPRRYNVIADRIDAWSIYRNEPIGAVFLRRLPDKDGQAQVQAFQVTCPHAGCSVDFDLDGQIFRCPCHRSRWKSDGTLMPTSSGKPSPSPRGLDELEVRIEGDNVLVHYQEFRPATAEKIPIA
jgi:menaquinol-cytochrome c reductase iron-sulfur subunit